MLRQYRRLPSRRTCSLSLPLVWLGASAWVSILPLLLVSWPVLTFSLRLGRCRRLNRLKAAGSRSHRPSQSRRTWTSWPGLVWELPFSWARGQRPSEERRRHRHCRKRSVCCRRFCRGHSWRYRWLSSWHLKKPLRINI